MTLERHGHSRGGVKKACVPSSSPYRRKVSAEGEGLLRACGYSHCGNVKSVFDNAVLRIGHSVSLSVNTV